MGRGWVEGEVKLYYWEGAKKITAGGRGEGEVKTFTEREQKNSLPVEEGWVEGEMKTLLLGGSTKKINAGGRGLSWRKSEDFITGREHKNSLPVGGGWAEKRETLLPGGNTKIHCRCEWGWVCGGKCEDFVTGRWPRSRNIKSESKVGKHKATK